MAAINVKCLSARSVSNTGMIQSISNCMLNLRFTFLLYEYGMIYFLSFNTKILKFLCMKFLSVIILAIYFTIEQEDPACHVT